MKVLLVLAAVIFLSPSAFADFSGHWFGTGSMKDNGTWHSACQSLDLVITQTATEFEVVSMNFMCGSVGTVSKQATVETISNGVVYFQNRAIGTASNDTILIQVSDPKFGISWWMFVLKPDGTMAYSDHAGLAGGGYFEINGVLSR